MASRKKTQKPKRAARPVAERKDAIPDDTDSWFPIVAIGGSAGGLEALTDLLRATPADTGAAFVYIGHLDPKHASALPQILARETTMPVFEVTDGTELAKNSFYVMPPNVEMMIVNGVLQLTPSGDQRPHMPIDTFLRSLARDQGSRAISIILSGSASDGTLGTRAVKSEGGITFAQDETAKFDGMPKSAVAAGSVDFVLPPREIAREIQRISRHSYMSVESAEPPQLPQSDLAKIYAILQSSHEIDFTHYKPSTIDRRIRRRMALNKVDAIENYLAILRDNPGEVEQLYGDILIRVTGFFRDPDVFDALKKEILPRIINAPGQQIRIWVPGCATGEEVYSLAMSVLETASEAGINDCPLQLFGTDVSEVAVERARAAVYPETIAAEVSPERLRRFFRKVDGMYRVSKSVRDCVIFARQDVTRDPPFSKLDLISCRNVMIYLGMVLQKKVMSIFHYALRPNGYLLLGSSETIGNFGELFSVIDRKHKIYRKKAATAHLAMDFDPGAPNEPVRRLRDDSETLAPVNVFREADRIALSRYAPSGVLVNESGEIVQFRGRTSLFLEPAPGAANFNIFKMAREGLLSELRTAMHSATKQDTAVRREGVRVRNNGSFIMTNFEVLPFVTAGKERFHLIIFEEAFVPATKGKKKPAAKQQRSDNQQLGRLKRELEATREYLQSVIEEQESMNEELRSANEEIQSSNEELQSTNEELETAKEELQSSNEELTTLNEELENRNSELGLVNDDLVNILGSLDIPVLMLDSNLRIRRFNPGAQKMLGFVPADIGRPIADLTTTLNVPDLTDRIHSVIDTLAMHESTVIDRAGRKFILRIRPYRTSENKIEGAVIVLIDIEQVRRAPGA